MKKQEILIGAVQVSRVALALCCLHFMCCFDLDKTFCSVSI